MVGQIKHIVVIESLDDNEKKTGKELYDDCINKRIRLFDKTISHKFYSISTKEEMVNILNELSMVSDSFDDGIVIHLEMHGDSYLKGLVLSEGTLINWTELANLFREINIGSCNKLYITMATCYGRYLYKGGDSSKKSPYSGYISASKEVNTGEILENFDVLFTDLIENGNIVKAYLELEKLKSKFYYKDSKTVFEDNFKEFKNNKDVRKKLVDQIKIDIKNKGGNQPDEAMIESTLNKVLEDTYSSQKKAFDF